MVDVAPIGAGVPGSFYESREWGLPGISGNPGRRSVFVCHLEDLFPGVLADKVRVIGRDVRLDVPDQLVVGLAFDVRAARAVDDFHSSLLVRWTGR